MANLKETLESIMPGQPKMQKLFPTGASLNELDSKNVRFKIKKVKTDVLDVDEVTIEIRSDEKIDQAIHVNTIISAMQELQGELIRYVILEGYEITNSDLALYNFAEIRFTLIHDVEKE